MVHTFYPRIIKYIRASSPHPDGTEYRISLGDEQFEDGTFSTVVIVHMVYNGKVDIRIAPSFPVRSDDKERVLEIINDMIIENNNRFEKKKD